MGFFPPAYEYDFSETAIRFAIHDLRTSEKLVYTPFPNETGPSRWQGQRQDGGPIAKISGQILLPSTSARKNFVVGTFFPGSGAPMSASPCASNESGPLSPLFVFPQDRGLPRRFTARGRRLAGHAGPSRLEGGSGTPLFTPVHESAQPIRIH